MIIDNKRLISEKTASDYQQEFRSIAMDLSSGLDRTEWTAMYKRIVDWELKLDSSDNDQLKGILDMQKNHTKTTN